MRVKYLYTWGYFHPVTCGADLVARNQLDYFRQRGWEVDCLLVRDPRKEAYADAFKSRYDWLRSVTVLDLPPAAFNFRDQCLAYQALSRQPDVREALAAPADLFFTNYVHTTPLLPHLPRGCKRVLETHDLISLQFELGDRMARGGSTAAPDALARIKTPFLLDVELDLYRLYDTVLMINAEELAFVQARGVRNAVYVPQNVGGPAGGVPEPPAQDYDLLFVGSGNPINREALTWFHRRVYVPYLWSKQARFAVVGGVCDHVDVEDVYLRLLRQIDQPIERVYAASKVVVVPVLAGTGLSMKTLEALSLGKAVVTTPVGARGLDASRNAFVRIDMQADPKGTAAVLLDLLGDSGKRRQLEQEGLAYVRKCFGPESYAAAMDQAVRAAGLDPLAASRAATLPRAA